MSGSDENYEFKCKKSLSTPRRKRQFESDDENDNKISCRSSDRIWQKKNKRFRMPSRDEVWNSIPSSTTPEKALSDIKPKKLVSNLTRVYNSYNVERVSSEDESLSDFIDDHISGETSSSEEEEHKGSRIKNYKKKFHRVSALDSDSDSDTDMEKTKLSDKNKKSKHVSSDNNTSDSGSYCTKRRKKTQSKRKETGSKCVKRKKNVLNDECSSEEDFEDKNYRMKGNCIKSNTESGSQNSDPVPSTSGMNQKKRAVRIEEDDEGDGSASDAESSEGDAVAVSSKRRSNVIDSDSSEDNIEKGSESRRSDRAREQMEAKKTARASLFQELKEARKRSLSGEKS